jgi:hypothetical protein
MGETRDVDPRAATLDAASRAAGDAAHTLTGSPIVRPQASESMVGRQFAHFRIDKPIGAGGMGEVYLASDLALDRRVALKLLPRAFAADPPSRERFIREARAQARLNHPNICHIYFIGEQDAQLFFAMEYVEGESLQQILDRAKRIPVADAIEYVRMAALGLREAQRLGFTHATSSHRTSSSTATASSSWSISASPRNSTAARPRRGRTSSWGPRSTCPRSRRAALRWTSAPTSIPSA